jgi:hypothetical protein
MLFSSYACLPRSKYKKINKISRLVWYRTRMYACGTVLYDHFLLKKIIAKTPDKKVLLPHLGRRYSPRICNTFGTSVFSFATPLSQALSHLQHLWQSWCNILATAGAPATSQPHCLCNISTAVVASTVFHIAYATFPPQLLPLQCWSPCNIFAMLAPLQHPYCRWCPCCS